MVAAKGCIHGGAALALGLWWMYFRFEPPDVFTGLTTHRAKSDSSGLRLPRRRSRRLA
jgi:hypothetical protein